MPDDLADQLYEAAFIPELWPAACDAIASLAGAYSAAIVTLDDQHTYRWVSSPRIHEAMLNFSTSDMRFENTRPARHIQSRSFSFIRDVDVMTDDEIENDPIYRELMRPMGLGWTAGDVVQEPSGHLLIVDLIRETVKGPFESDAIVRMNELKPHLSRASFLASRLAFAQARNTVETLDMVGLPAAVIGDHGRVIEANSQFQQLAPQVLVGAGNSVVLSSEAAGSLLDAAIVAARSAGPAAVQSIPLPARTEEESPLIINVVPVKNQSRDMFARSSSILIVTKVGATVTLDPQVLRGLFDMTPSEARIAWAIGSGSTVEQAAAANAISKETVRTYLKRIMMKTGVRTQAQLVLLLRGLPMF